MAELGKKISNTFEECKSLESELGCNPVQHDVEIKITEAEAVIHSLSEGCLAKRNAVLKTPVKKAIQFYYLNKLKKLNELESKKAELQHSVEMKRKQDAAY